MVCKDGCYCRITLTSLIGILVQNVDPIFKYENAQGNTSEQLKALGLESRAKYNAIPTLMVIVLPDGSNDLYSRIKQYVFLLAKGFLGSNYSL